MGNANNILYFIAAVYTKCCVALRIFSGKRPTTESRWALLSGCRMERRVFPPLVWCLRLLLPLRDGGLLSGQVLLHGEQEHQ
ncbi:MAG: hypothetical protein LUE61_01055, partial [Clostridiales bacterium]|nr:hypothetical protein [Clostridiales bacterium]